MEERESEAESQDLDTLAGQGTAGRRLGEAGLALFFAFFGLIIGFPPSGTPLLPWVLVPILSGLTSLHFLLRVFDRRARLIIDAEGITDRTSIGGGELRIPWAEVLSVSTSGWQSTVELQVRDPSALRQGVGPSRRLWMWLGHVFGKRSVSITPTLLGMNKKKLHESLDDGLLRFERSELGLAAQIEGPPQLGP